MYVGQQVVKDPPILLFCQEAAEVSQCTTVWEQ